MKINLWTFTLFALHFPAWTEHCVSVFEACNKKTFTFSISRKNKLFSPALLFKLGAFRKNMKKIISSAHATISIEDFVNKKEQCGGGN